MNSYSLLGVFAVIVGALISLVTYANRAGRNAARVKESETQASLAQQTSIIMQHMAQVEADKPVSLEAITSRLEKGDA
ncbi:hypothetical protein [Aristophania vespae]|uniref:hypothetical protein n=1 Tax=Aristophania vespae TaxID=2697033 RepID=UPI00235194E5|nr:hypothetical protein [Aristophania vespae]UMM63081.1 hypothetical protein DM15PD_00350 [Aristophania vespae]UMM63085.1 hypothetical protein DM15PD_00390 [Aristophania vespae]